MVEVGAENKEVEVYNIEEYMSEEVVYGAAANMKTELLSQMSPITLKIQIGLHYQMIQRRGSLRNHCTKSS